MENKVEDIQETIDRRKEEGFLKQQLAVLGERHSKHARWMYVDGELVKFHMTRRRPWVVRAERRKKDKQAKLSRRRNR